MKRFINTIYPNFLYDFQQRLLKNNVLAWQLQLPVILWIWLLVTIITLPAAILYPVAISNNMDIASVILISVLIGVLQFFFFVYILRQFNASKSYGLKIPFRGIKEQMAYLLVMLLCFTAIIFFPLILNFRKGNKMTEDEIKREAKIYNNGRHYFMENYNDYLYFPDTNTFIGYMNFAPHYDRDNSTIIGKHKNRDEYYHNYVVPMMDGYFNDDSAMSINPKYTRDVAAPKLFYVGEYFMNEWDTTLSRDQTSSIAPSEIYVETVNSESNFNTKFRRQLRNKSDAERQREISDFLMLFLKYNERKNSSIYFDSPEVILKKYKSNLFSVVVYDKTTEYEGNLLSNGTSNISNVHETIMGAKEDKWADTLDRVRVSLVMALALSVLLFVFKNMRRREFFQTLVVGAFLTLVVSIFTTIFHLEELLPLIVFLTLFLSGLFLAVKVDSWSHFSNKKAIAVILSNLIFSFVPLLIFIFFNRYLGVLDYDPVYCEKHLEECQAKQELVSDLKTYLFWGGIAFYLVGGGWFYKKTYEKIFALPMAK